MIKVCIISPASHLEQYSSLGDCEMVLSHLVLPDEGFHHTDFVKQNYVKYYKEQTKKGRWTILDNSAYEIGKLEAKQATGKGLGPDIVLRAAEIINPSIVIAQDVLCDRDQTYLATKDFIKYVKSKGLLNKFKIMAVPQGKTSSEWLSSYEELMMLPEVDQVGFSKISVPLSFGDDQISNNCVSLARLKCTQMVEDTFGEMCKQAHLLGGDNSLPWELSIQKKHNWIFSNDSSACVWYGAHGQRFNKDGKIDNIITIKPDLENNNVDTVDLLNKYSETIIDNIKTLVDISK